MWISAWSKWHRWGYNWPLFREHPLSYLVQNSPLIQHENWVVPWVLREMIVSILARTWYYCEYVCLIMKCEGTDIVRPGRCRMVRGCGSLLKVLLCHCWMSYIYIYTYVCLCVCVCVCLCVCVCKRWSLVIWASHYRLPSRCGGVKVLHGEIVRPESTHFREFMCPIRKCGPSPTTTTKFGHNHIILSMIESGICQWMHPHWPLSTQTANSSHK